MKIVIIITKVITSLLHTPQKSENLSLTKLLFNKMCLSN
jgi:hypothetical protein